MASNSTAEVKGEYYLLVKEPRLQDAEYFFKFCRNCDNCLSQGYNVAAESSIILACCMLVMGRSYTSKLRYEE